MVRRKRSFRAPGPSHHHERQRADRHPDFGQAHRHNAPKSSALVGVAGAVIAMGKQSAITRMGERIRCIVCTALDETTARLEIEAVIRETAYAMNVPVLIGDQRFTNELLRLPLRERAERLRRQGHQISTDDTTGIDTER
jgi:hypothetical protein